MASTSQVLFFTLLSALCMGSLAIPPALRIIGGSEASGEDFPYMVSIRRDSAHVCGGAIIEKNFILTAAHCVSDIGTKPVDTSAITVRVGSKNQFAGGKLVPVEKIFIHESYGSFLNDVAVLRIPELTYTPKIQKINLASRSDAVLAGESVVIAGWGRTESNGANAYKLQHGDATVLSAADCEDQIGYGHASTICLKTRSNASSCNGDAGGPAVYKNELVGVSNFVIGACGTIYPDVFGRVSYFHDWILDKINSSKNV